MVSVEKFIIYPLKVPTALPWDMNIESNVDKMIVKTYIFFFFLTVTKVNLTR